MRILKVCASRSWGGMEMSMVATAAGLRDRGHAVFPVCRPNSPIERHLVDRGFDPLRSDLWGKFHPLQAVRLARYARRHRIDVIHTDKSRDLFTLVPVKQLAGGLPLVLHKHIGTLRPKNLFVHHYLYPRVDRVIAISEVIGRNLLDTHPLRPGQVVVLHQGIDPAGYAPDPEARARVRAELAVPADGALVGIVGRLQQEKGQLDLLDVAERLANEHPRTRWVVIGTATVGQQEEAAAITRAFAASPVADRIVLTGFRRDVPDLLRAMDVFLFPSHAEAYGLVVLEAMAAGLPVVAYGCDGVLDLVVPGETGELVAPRDREALAAATAGLLADAERRRVLGEAGRARVAARFTEERFYAELVALYARLVRARRRNS